MSQLPSQMKGRGEKTDGGGADQEKPQRHQPIAGRGPHLDLVQNSDKQIFMKQLEIGRLTVLDDLKLLLIRCGDGGLVTFLKVLLFSRYTLKYLQMK